MEIKQYIQSCIEQNDISELSASWYYAGSSVCTNDTRFYKSGNVYLIKNDDSSFNNQLFYCDNDYIGQIAWEDVVEINEAQRTTLSNGLTATCFTFFEKELDQTNVSTYVNALEADETYKPFTKYADLASTLTNILIDDDQYYQIMQVIGQPWIEDSELEYKRQAILKLAVEPALRMYYTYFPLIQEQVVQHNLGDFLIPYPTVPYPAYKAIAWVTSPGSTTKGAMSGNGLSPLAALGTDISLYNRSAAGGSGRMNVGLKYSNKAVPGFTGESMAAGSSAFSELATAWPIANTLKNMMRREKLSKIHIPGQGLFAKGYSNMSGFWSKVVKLCQAHVKFSIGAIRDLLRSDSNIPFREGIQKEGKDEIDAIEKEWSESPYRLIYTPSRGGLVG